MVQVTQSEFVNTFTPKGKEKIWTELKMTKNKTAANFSVRIALIFTFRVFVFNIYLRNVSYVDKQTAYILWKDQAADKANYFTFTKQLLSVPLFVFRVTMQRKDKQ